MKKECMSEITVAFQDIDEDGNRGIVIENTWFRAIIHVPENLGEVRSQVVLGWPSSEVGLQTDRPVGLPEAAVTL